jgi:hypothetical protein
MNPSQQLLIPYARSVDVEDDYLEAGFRKMMLDFIACVECRDAQPCVLKALSQKASVG